MHERVFFNTDLVDAANLQISPVSGAALYGKGIFTTLAIYNGEPFLWEKHWRRLSRDASDLGIDLKGISEASTKNALGELISANSVLDGSARITLFDESPSLIWPSKLEGQTSVLIMTGDRRPVPDNFRVQLS